MERNKSKVSFEEKFILNWCIFSTTVNPLVELPAGEPH